MEHKVLFRVFALTLGFLGSIFLLNEPVRLRLKKGNVEVDTDMKGYRNRLKMRRTGIVLLVFSFLLQIIAIIAYS